eukprot:CAMPEP_0179136988 /NCGR_PEP_ID=MMETSP0796-20121207/65317_1 /TAXON_ID=73915 /ORGANISM="Pyrodinium bahamense, Strain pbaha01" /LENGTH=201 /DNA_ID=CAMNT_0020836123 /DNA_START=17 /DNA_END=619 /DNA_ORIENTATION=-
MTAPAFEEPCKPIRASGAGLLSEQALHEQQADELRVPPAQRPQARQGRARAHRVQVGELLVQLGQEEPQPSVGPEAQGRAASKQADDPLGRGTGNDITETASEAVQERLVRVAHVRESTEHLVNLLRKKLLARAENLLERASKRNTSPLRSSLRSESVRRTALGSMVGASCARRNRVAGDTPFTRSATPRFGSAWQTAWTG